MDLRTTPNMVHLSESGRRSLRLESAKGFRIVAVSGKVWVTQAGFMRDYVLHPGDALTLESSGLAVATSFGPADIEVIAPPAEAPLRGSSRISVEALERAQREAHRLRAEALQEMVSAAAAWARKLSRRLASVVTTTGPANSTRQHC